ncbi:MAG: S41 family peptidase [Thermoanaerobaculaceae bacterium]|nr:S41 family peptidase [Thermoanaerobaculaceae bacterium]
MKKRILAAVVLLVPLAVRAAAPAGPRQVSADEKRQAVAELATTLRARYAIGDTAETVAKAIEDRLARGGYDALTDAQAFADAIEADLRAVTRDRHMRFGVAPPPEPTPAPGAPTAPGTTSAADAERTAWLARMRSGNYGLPRAEVLPGNVGYLEVRRFQPPDLAGDTIAAAIAYLANCDAVIVDLRNCRGGSAHVMPMFTGYFLARPTSLYDMVFRGDSFTERFWSAAWLPGKRLAEVPMYILTSSYTFSGAEALAYRFKVLKRATIVGETTGGGANAGGILDVAPGFRVWMPMGRPVDRTTGTNWEGTGVEPDIRTSAREALAAGHAEAIKVLKGRAATEEEKARLDFALERAGGRHHPPSLGAQDLERLAGAYGPYRVWVEGDQLRVQRADEEPYLLVPLGRTVFASETDDPVRVEIACTPDGRPQRLLFTDRDGSREESPRSP